MLLVFYGKGKGKTTAAYGTAIRALGRGWRVVVASFMKSGDSGEIELLRKLELPVKVYVLGTREFVKPGDYEGEAASENMAKAYAFLRYELPKLMRNYKPKLVVFDELGLAVHLALVDEGTATRVLKRFTGDRELHAIVTGRYVPNTLKNMADLISEVREVKHYFRRGYINVVGLDR
ncbi:MAG: cob(I)yrinic acid a,c-diamide adenosyltransferase [Sulfolobales archaeon]|nr:cob(I)yrinic acid a,c-diamide adenosyltransferase [Sulfolobales archaeon]MDW8082960.1 cob(I)yrinic acid a,c-diamide adenosyltransferase [Sulfolobales archaeon]